MSNLTFNYPVQKLILQLQENRQKHEADYRKAIEGYKKELQEVFDKACLKIDTNIGKINGQLESDNHMSVDLHNIIKGVTLSVEKPKHYLKYYDEALAMLDMTADETIALPRQEFNQLVLDKWEWQKVFKASTSKYLD